ncbi:MAG TPA: hypothetical protein VGW78_03375 [Candidatus Babeliales bacterium]|jgi:hypothetical protein|nr:hypothetical protein [Candidatus Babeliales bacterium]
MIKKLMCSLIFIGLYSTTISICGDPKGSIVAPNAEQEQEVQALRVDMDKLNNYFYSPKHFFISLLKWSPMLIGLAALNIKAQGRN